MRDAVTQPNQGVSADEERGALRNEPLHAHVVRAFFRSEDATGRVRNGADARRKAAALRLARAKEREANRRRDYLHKQARAIVNTAGTIALETLNLRAMTRSAKGSVERPGRNVRAKAALNRRILDTGFGQFERLIIEKAEEAARVVVRVDARFSSQQCSHCGHVARESRRKRRFCCVRCRFATHADVNAALVIRGRAQSSALRMPDAGAKPVTQQDAA
jgi:putative transposase